MNAAEIIVLLVVILIAGLALRSIIKDKKSKKGCNGDCASCGSSCTANLEKEFKIKK